MQVGTLTITRPSSIPSRPWPAQQHAMTLDRQLGARAGYASAQDAFDAAYYLTTSTTVGAAAVVQAADGSARIFAVTLDGRTSFGMSQLVRQHGASNVTLTLSDPSIVAIVDGTTYVTRA